MLNPIYICGSTASGKSSLAIALAQACDGEVINGDAYQVYRGIEILSAAPSQEELAAAPHHLFSVLPTSENMDAQRYRELALPCIEEVQSRGKRPIVVGGSGMYLKFLTHDPSPVPSGDPSLREQLETRTDTELVTQLESLDPEGAAMTNLKNRRYVIRALEICLLSGQKMSEIKNDWKKTSDSIDSDLKGFVLQWEAEPLRKRIGLRTQMMLDQGVIDEVKALSNTSATCEKAIGVKPLRDYLNGEISLERCKELIYFATCQYAKRQRTWFKKEQWLHPLPVNEQSKIDQLVEQCLTHL